MDLLAATLIQVLSGIATLVLISIGLAVVFGMMRVINLAHGEFLMLGGYAAVVAHQQGLNLWIAMLIVAPLVVGAVGMAVERLVIRPLTGRMVDSLLATWGLSLLLIGLATTIFGNVTRGVSAPLGAVQIGGFRVGQYQLVLIAFAALIVLALFAGLKWTRAGMVARATMQNPAMAAALGVDRDRVYALTFGLGAGLSGLAGALLAPVSGIVPTIGAAYVAKAFITVISGGAAVVSGTLAAAGLLGAVNTAATFLATPVVGEVALLLAAIVLLRVWPQGLSGRLFRGAV